MAMKKFIRGGISRVKRYTLFVLGRSKEPGTHRYKESVVEKYAKKYKCNVFLETGTYRAEMDLGVYDNFDYLASVEIQNFLYEENKKKLKNRDRLYLYNGDSTVQIPIMLKEIRNHYKGRNYKICFWLDGHYSKGDTGKGEKDTPIMEELQEIKNAGIGACVILIDDARCFTHEGEFIDYPTIPYLRRYVGTLFKNSTFQVRNDIIRITVRD